MSDAFTRQVSCSPCLRSNCQTFLHRRRNQIQEFLHCLEFWDRWLWGWNHVHVKRMCVGLCAEMTKGAGLWFISPLMESDGGGTDLKQQPVRRPQRVKVTEKLWVIRVITAKKQTSARLRIAAFSAQKHHSRHFFLFFDDSLTHKHMIVYCLIQRVTCHTVHRWSFVNQAALDVPGRAVKSCLVIHANKPLASIPFLSDCVNKLFRSSLHASRQAPLVFTTRVSFILSLDIWSDSRAVPLEAVTPQK